MMQPENKCQSCRSSQWAASTKVRLTPEDPTGHLICADDNSTHYLQPVPDKACKLFYYEPGSTDE